MLADVRHLVSGNASSSTVLIVEASSRVREPEAHQGHLLLQAGVLILLSLLVGELEDTIPRASSLLRK